jgi:hypothetical protein
LVIKEVNPLLLDWVNNKFNPKVIYLVRHPAAVALSMMSKGWERDPLDRKFTRSRLAELTSRSHLPNPGSYWERHGAFQAITQRIALDALKGVDQVRVVRYEDLCRDPVGGFAALYEFAGLLFDEKVAMRVAAESNARMDGYSVGGYDTSRDSRLMPNQWKHRVSPEQLAELRRGYMANEPLYYNQPSDWAL